jgi:hypothetical protein
MLKAIDILLSDAAPCTIPLIVSMHSIADYKDIAPEDEDQFNALEPHGSLCAAKFAKT